MRNICVLSKILVGKLKNFHAFLFHHNNIMKRVYLLKLGQIASYIFILYIFEPYKQDIQNLEGI